jgi:N-acetylneuraminic acid mutarotase
MRADHGAALAGNGKVYAIGGIDNGHQTVDMVEEYDPSSNTWATRASLPTPRSALAVATGANGMVYAIGGGSVPGGPPSPVGVVEAYDPSLNAWSGRAPMPTARHSLGLVSAPNGRLYAIGGNSLSGVTSVVEEYDPANDMWTARASMPTARYGLRAVLGPNGKIYAIGGWTISVPLNVVEKYDPVADTWTSCDSLPTARAGFGAAVGGNGRIYAIGGGGTGATSGTNEEGAIQ